MRFVDSPFLRHFRLDIVGFLAILGEASVLENAQIAFLSPAGFLPRLVPAPQALFRTKRPGRLATLPGIVVGCKSGNASNHISHLAHILHHVEDFPRFHIKCLNITKKGADTDGANGPELKVKIATWGPLTMLAFGGFGLFLTLIALAVYFEDGMGLLSTLFLGLLSTLIQIGSFSTLEFAPFRNKRPLPKSHVVVKYPNGSFVYVECHEEIARKLYFETEECRYRATEKTYRFIALVGTLMLMGGVIALANAKIELQLAYGSAYIVLNAAFWLVASLPSKLHWNLDCFDVELTRVAATENYTQALWTMIALTGTTEWIKITDIAPRNNPWEKWIAEAQTNLTSSAVFDAAGRLEQPSWDSQAALTRHIAASLEVDTVSTGHGSEFKENPRSEEQKKLEDEDNAEALDAMAMPVPTYGVRRVSLAE